MYEIRYKNIVIGLTELDRADPPMGFVHGAVNVNDKYDKNKKEILKNSIYLTVHELDKNNSLEVEAITIEDFSEKLGEEVVEVTVLMKTSEDFEKQFKKHSDAYEKQFN